MIIPILEMRSLGIEKLVNLPRVRDDGRSSNARKVF